MDRTGVARVLDQMASLLDLKGENAFRVRALRTASRAAGVMISIGADAHSVAGLENVTWGVGVARKAGLGPADILNARSLEDFLAFARARRGT